MPQLPDLPIPHEDVSESWTVLHQRPASETQQAAAYLLATDTTAPYRRFRVTTDSSGYPVEVWVNLWVNVIRLGNDEVTDSIAAADIAYTIVNGEAP